MAENWYEEVLIAHMNELDSRFPPDQSVNIGWVVDDIDQTIASKVYGQGILTSGYANDEVVHSFEEFEA